MTVKKFGIGASALRKEDLSLLKGEGKFTDDFKLGNVLHGFVVRSQHAHANFEIVSIEAAQAAPGVRLVLTAADIAHLGKVPCLAPVRQPDGKVHDLREASVLCEKTVRHAGDAIAFIVAESRELAEDAAELIEVDWTALDTITDLAIALDDGVPLVWPERGSNQVFLHHTGDKARTDAAFDAAAHITNLRIVNNRIISNYLEPRAAVAIYDAAGESFTLHTPSQGVHAIRDVIAGKIFHMDPDKVTVITGDVGGGFGTKGFFYREYALVLESARRLGQPVRWLSTRTEHALADTHGRDSIADASFAFDSNYHITGMRIEMVANLGAYLSQYGPFVPTMAAIMATGVYDIPALDMTIRAAYTNTTPVDAYRGAGRPEAAYLVERLMDASARDLGVSPDELRRINFIRPEQFPYKTQGGCLYDVGEFAGHLDLAQSITGWNDFAARYEASAANGKIRGRGLSTYVEICAFPGSEPAHLHLNEDGTITLYIGTQANGQGHITAYSQFIAEKIGIDFDKIIVRQGDTRELKEGGGTGGSRSIPLGGVSVDRASDELALKIKRIAGDEMEASPDDIELVDGFARVAGTDKALSFADVAKKAKTADDRIAIADVQQDGATFPNGTHIVEVEIDPETGSTDIVDYQIVDDFGVTVNPVLLGGQIHGGIAQGVGQALMEGAAYSEDGQLLTATFMDYAMPRADSFPFFKFETRNVPSITNALGVKGAGEAATIGSTPAVMNAVIDALYRGYGIRSLDMPATPGKVWEAIQAANAA
jgi:carbon-monoxide dehydrogenase large subunit